MLGVVLVLATLWVLEPDPDASEETSASEDESPGKKRDPGPGADMGQVTHAPATASSSSPASDMMTAQYEDPSLWRTDCTDSEEPDRMNVLSVVESSSDRYSGSFVVATCFYATAAGFTELAYFPDGGGIPETLIGPEALGQPFVETVRTGYRLLVRGSRFSLDDPGCCRNVDFRQIFDLEEEGWTSNGPRVWPANQTRVVGYGVTKLGMTAEELEASGAVTAGPAEGDICDSYALKSGGTARVNGWGVVDIEFGPNMRTSKGIELGSSEGDFLAAYPGAIPDFVQGAWGVRVSPEATYVIGIEDELVRQITLKDSDSGCFT